MKKRRQKRGKNVALKTQRQNRVSRKRERHTNRERFGYCISASTHGVGKNDGLPYYWTGKDFDSEKRKAARYATEKEAYATAKALKPLPRFVKHLDIVK